MRPRSIRPSLADARSAGRGVRHRGLTLIELLTTLALAAILLTLGVPAFNEVMARHRVTTAANGLLADVHLARSEALKRGVRVALCTGSETETSPGFACAAGDWHSGYLIFIDADGDGVIDAPSDVLRVVAGTPNAPIPIAGDRQVVTFFADGTADLTDDTPLTWTLSDPGSHNPRIITLARTGRAMSCDPARRP